LFYRGWALAPRDLFDWWAIETQMPQCIPTEKMAALLRTKVSGIRQALTAMPKSGLAQSLWNAIQAPNKPSLSFVVNWAAESLINYVSIDNQSIATRQANSRTDFSSNK
jgi:hypothetical protein